MTPPPLPEDALLAFTELNRVLGVEPKLSKSEWGQILKFLGPVFDLTLVPGSPPILYLSQQWKDKLRAQISEILETGEASAAARQKLVGDLSFAQTATIGKIDRATFRPSCIQSNSEGATRALSPASLRALEWWHRALSTWGSR